MNNGRKKTYEIEYLQILDDEGRLLLSPDDTVLAPFTDELVKTIFEKMILARTYNSRAVSLQREGRIGTYPSIYGQEAAQVASALTIEALDWVFPSFREVGALIALGYPPSLLFRYWAGDERGMKGPKDFPYKIFPISVAVGTHISHATGAAMAMQIKDDPRVSFCYFGDGATSRGDFHEGLNFAGTFKAPVVFICQNNQWAISVSRAKQSASETIACKAVAYGISGIEVDGNDPLAVYAATSAASKRARAGGGPTLIECVTYRLDNHTTADDASRYRTDDEVEKWEAREPLKRMRLYMKTRGLWTKEYEEETTAKALEIMDSEIEAEEHMEPPKGSDIINYTSATLSARQKRGLDWLKPEK